MDVTQTAYRAYNFRCMNLHGLSLHNLKRPKIAGCSGRDESICGALSISICGRLCCFPDDYGSVSTHVHAGAPNCVLGAATIHK